MRILIPGGSGQVGTLLARHLFAAGHEVTVLSRHPKAHTEQRWRTLAWDGLTPGPWASEIDRSDVVIHLSGRSVNCRYTAKNRREIMDSRTKPTRLLGEVIAASPTPPRLWMNASTSTIYPAAFDVAQDEFTAQPSDLVPQPDRWPFSIDVARQWEQALAAIPTPRTRKIRMRLSMTMSPDPGGVFSVFSRLARLGLGGTQGPGTQFVSWIHDIDYCRIVDLLLARPEITDETDGAVNFTAPAPLPNRDFMRILRDAWGRPIGLPASRWMLEIGTFVMRTESELVLKSRRAVPTLLLKNGFDFQFPTWPDAAKNLVERSRIPKITSTPDS